MANGVLYRKVFIIAQFILVSCQRPRCRLMLLPDRQRADTGHDAMSRGKGRLFASLRRVGACNR